MLSVVNDTFPKGQSPVTCTDPCPPAAPTGLCQSWSNATRGQTGAAMKTDTLLPRRGRGSLLGLGLAWNGRGPCTPSTLQNADSAEQGAPESACPGSAVRRGLVPQFPLVKYDIAISLRCCKGHIWPLSQVRAGSWCPVRAQQRPARYSLGAPGQTTGAQTEAPVAHEGQEPAQWLLAGWRRDPPGTLVAGAPRSYQGGRSPCGSCLSRGCSCYRPLGRRRTCPACGWRTAPRHSRWAAGREVERAAGRAPRLPPPQAGRWAVSTVRPVVLVLQCLTTSHFPDTQTPRRSVSLQDVPSRAGTMSCRWPSTVVQCRSHGLLEMWT